MGRGKKVRDKNGNRIAYQFRFSEKPGKRGDCENVVRPCPFVFCRYNLFSNIRSTGLVDLAFQNTQYSCVLDVIEENGRVSLEDVGRLLNVTRTRVEAIEKQALEKLAGKPEVKELKELAELLELNHDSIF